MLHCTRRSTWRGAVGAALLLLLGCSGEKTGTVAGKVAYKGQPVANWAIQLLDTKHGLGDIAKLSEAGEFTLATPLPIGSYRVFFSVPLGEPPLPGQAGTTAPTRTPIPKKYLSDQTSDLNAEVKPGPNQLTLELKE